MHENAGEQSDHAESETSAEATAGDTGERATTPTTDVDFLIELRQKLAEGYKDRCAQADGIAGGALTACVSVSALIVAANATLALTNRTVAVIALVTLAASALAAAWARSGAGLRPLAPKQRRGLWHLMPGRNAVDADNLDKGTLLSHETAGFRIALEDIRSKTDQLPVGLHKDALSLWAARERALHRTARAKEQAAGAAGVLLVIGIFLTAWLSILLVVDQPKKAGKHAAVPAARAAVVVTPGTIGHR